MGREGRSSSQDPSAKDLTALPDWEGRRRFAFAFRYVMQERGIDAAELARRMEKSPNTIARWNRGETLPNVIDIGVMSEILAVDPVLFVNPPPVPEYPLEDYLTDEGKANLARARREGRYLL